MFEALVKLDERLVPEWAHESSIYSAIDGAGTSHSQSIAIHKAISEALERWAFYETIERFPRGYSFDENPSTTGIAAFPDVTCFRARKNAILEASERWALHEFWRESLPVIEHRVVVPNLRHFEIKTNFKSITISLLMYENEEQFFYAFASGMHLTQSFSHALVELSRNIRVLKKFRGSNKKFSDFSDVFDKRLYFFSSNDRNQMFLQKVLNAPNTIKTEPIIACDQEILGEWSQYAKVWRFLYKNSFPDSVDDHTFFMF